jgi:hypothetical protein
MKIFPEGHTLEEIRRRPQSGFAMAATMSIVVEIEET